jgi:hypothetical protein
MGVWISEEGGPSCKPCLLAPVASWYESELRAKGRADLADRIVTAAEDQSLTPEAFAAELDSVKESSGDLAERLKDFDCAAQTYPGETVEGGNVNEAQPAGN